MTSAVFDTSVLIAFKPQLPSATRFCVVVIQELMAGARDGSELRSWEATANRLEKDGRLLVPTTEYWLLAGRVLNSLLRGLKSNLERVPPSHHQALQQDILTDVPDWHLSYSVVDFSFDLTNFWANHDLNSYRETPASCQVPLPAISLHSSIAYLYRLESSPQAFVTVTESTGRAGSRPAHSSPVEKEQNYVAVLLRPDQRRSLLRREALVRAQKDGHVILLFLYGRGMSRPTCAPM